jgi:hypothetical protein
MDQSAPEFQGRPAIRYRRGSKDRPEVPESRKITGGKTAGVTKDSLSAWHHKSGAEIGETSTHAIDSKTFGY